MNRIFVGQKKSRLWDFAHQVSAFSASLSGGSRPANLFPINTYDPEKKVSCKVVCIVAVFCAFSLYITLTPFFKIIIIIANNNK